MARRSEEGRYTSTSTMPVGCLFRAAKGRLKVLWLSALGLLSACEHCEQSSKIKIAAINAHTKTRRDLHRETAQRSDGLFVKR